MKLIVPSIFVLSTFMNSLCAADWEKLPPLPEPNAGFICGAFGADLVIAGGTNWKDDTKHWLDRVWLYDSRKGAWNQVGRLAAPLAYAAFGESNDGLWFAGGSSGSQTHLTLSLLDRQFAAKTVANIEPRFVYSAAAVLRRKLYVIGGAIDQAKAETMTNACFAIDLASGKVSRLADLPVPGFIVGAAAACAQQVFVFGGARWDEAAGAVRNLADAFAYAPAENRWQPLPPLPTPNRGLAAVMLDEGHIFIAGGYKNDVEEFTDDAFIFDVARGEYRPAKPLPHRALVALVKAGDFIYCLGGEDKKKHRSDACFRIRIEELLK